MSNNYTSGSGGGTSTNRSSFASRREARSNNPTGALPTLGVIGAEHSYAGPFDFAQFIESLHELFESDRQMASQPDATRCGVCYLHFSVNELHYREEGLYMCSGCEATLGNHQMPLVRQQQKL
ncbi:MAG TPA: hypothetical protein VHZ51_14780 [Ktedonobacteraceae bacterium]|nr:hypothetical protein [Ktedonobacteraceae bacterium]